MCGRPFLFLYPDLIPDMTWIVQSHAVSRTKHLQLLSAIKTTFTESAMHVKHSGNIQSPTNLNLLLYRYSLSAV